jgi:c-di-GMP-binding flagellar brake protein YcgR
LGALNKKGGQKMSFEDQRLHPRANLRWSVCLEVDGEVTEGTTKDISEGGAYVCCITPLGLKEEFSMVINTPEKQLNVKAQVVWANTFSLDEEITPRGMGVRFMNITGEDRTIIARAVAEHLAKYNIPENQQISMLDTLEIE